MKLSRLLDSRYSYLFLIIAVLSGCAAPTTQRVHVDDALVELEAKKQREIAIKSQINVQNRLMRVSYPILRSSASSCGDNVRKSLGFVFANKHEFSKEYQDAAVSSFEMGEALQVTYVIPGGPGDKEGLEVGDVLLRFNNNSVPTGKDAAKDFLKKVNTTMSKSTSVPIIVSRDRKKTNLSIIPDEICAYPVVVKQGDDTVNAYADGKKIVITRGMMRFAESDNELALVVSHELAHNSMKHMSSKMKNYVLGSIVDILAAGYGINTQGAFGEAAAGVYSKEFESEADYVGLYMMARAGLEIDNAATFWRRMAVEHPGSIKSNHSSSHPSTPYRFVAIEEAVEEIHLKEASGLPLEPAYKKDKKMSQEDKEGSYEEEDF